VRGGNNWFRFLTSPKNGDVPDGYVDIQGRGIGNMRMNVNVDKFDDAAQIMLVSKDNDRKIETTIGELKKERPTDYNKHLSNLQLDYYIYVKNADK
jgi:hypothetical protein